MKAAGELCSRVALCGGVPTLYVNGAPFPAAAYMTYLEAYNDYAGFTAAGYRLFSLPVLFAGRWINAQVDGVPFHRGIFDNRDAPDYSALDASVRAVLAACPAAYIFPRLNLSMPLWWFPEHPDCTDGTGGRELLFTSAYRETAAGMLRAVIRHIRQSDYASHIVGYQLAGGNTEEWFHFDLNGGACENAVPAFNEYLKNNCPDCGFSGLPDLSLLQQPGPYHGDAHLETFLEFSNAEVARTVALLCAVAKEETGGNQAVGTFYGYSLEVGSPLWGTHALRTLLEDGSVDFLCSPNSYIGTRDPHADWTEMYPADSVRLHGSLCMQECDIRTHLTKPLWQAAPEFDPEKRYTAPIWQGLAGPEESVSQLRKTFCRQLIKGNGFWWFDMWGGWYRDSVLYAELQRMREVYAASLSKTDRRSAAKLAVFADESAYRYLTDCGLRGFAFHARVPLGCMGAPYDVYDVCDFAKVYQKYAGVVFLSCVPTDAMRRALSLCGRDGVKYISLSEEQPQLSAAGLRDFCDACGVHVYCRTDDIIYANKNYLAVSATHAGEKTVFFEGVCAYRELLAAHGASGVGETLTLHMRENETRLFELAPLCADQ